MLFLLPFLAGSLLTHHTMSLFWLMERDKMYWLISKLLKWCEKMHKATRSNLVTLYICVCERERQRHRKTFISKKREERMEREAIDSVSLFNYFKFPVFFFFFLFLFWEGVNLMAIGYIITLCDNYLYCVFIFNIFNKICFLLCKSLASLVLKCLWRW